MPFRFPFITSVALVACTMGPCRVQAQAPTDEVAVPVIASAMTGQDEQPELPNIDANTNLHPSSSATYEVPDRELRHPDAVTVPADMDVEASRQILDERARLAYLESQSAREASDETWSARASNQVRQAVGDALRELEPGTEAPELLSVVCRTHFCRIEMAHPEVEPPSELFFGIGLRLRWTGAVLLNRLDDRTIVLYVARPGHSLPKPQ